jgi:hypothetical protein
VGYRDICAMVCISDSHGVGGISIQRETVIGKCPLGLGQNCPRVPRRTRTPGKKPSQKRKRGDPTPDSRLGVTSASEHQPAQWTRNILLSGEYHASALTGSMRLLFRVREREHAAVICLPRLRKVRSRILPVPTGGTDVTVMRAT